MKKPQEENDTSYQKPQEDRNTNLHTPPDEKNTNSQKTQEEKPKEEKSANLKTPQEEKATNFQKPQEERKKNFKTFSIIFVMTVIVVFSFLGLCLFQPLFPKKQKNRTKTLLSPLNVIEARMNEPLPYDILLKSTPKKIFMVDPTCIFMRRDYRKVFRKPHKACTTLQMALTNPNHTIYYLYSCPSDVELFRPIVEGMVSNIHLVNLEDVLPHLLSNPHIQPILPRLLKTEYRDRHWSDILRILVLWRYGGTYVDTGVLIIPPLETLEEDWVVFMRSSLTNRAMTFGATGPGHDYLTAVLEEMQRSESTQDPLSAYGPQLFTYVYANSPNKIKVEAPNILYSYYMTDGCYYENRDIYHQALKIYKQYHNHDQRLEHYFQQIEAHAMTPCPRGITFDIHILTLG